MNVKNLGLGLSSGRLLYRVPTLDDLNSIHELFGDWETTRYWFNGYSSSRGVSEVKLKQMIEHWRVYGFGDWILTETGTGAFVGFCGLHHLIDMQEVNVGYMIHRSKWGQGYALESAAVAVSKGLGELKLEQIVAVIQPPNLASIKVAERAGLKFWKNIEWQNGPRAVYSIWK